MNTWPKHLIIDSFFLIILNNCIFWVPKELFEALVITLEQQKCVQCCDGDEKLVDL